MKIWKRLLITFGVILTSGVAAAFIGAVLLAIADLYLSGHSFNWHKSEIFPGMDLQNLAFTILTLGTGLSAGVLTWYLTGKIKPGQGEE